MKLPLKHSVDRLRDHAAEALESGEQYLAAVVIEPIGHSARRDDMLHDGILGGVIGGAISSYQAKKDSEHLGDLAPANVAMGHYGAIVAATDRRFLIFDRGMTGKPGDLLGSWPVEGITVESSMHRVQGGRIESLRFVLPDHTLFAGECNYMVHGKDADALEDALSHAA